MNSEVRVDLLEKSREPPCPEPEEAGCATAPGFVARSRFVVANGIAAEVKAAFRNRPHLVEGAPGFLRMDVLSPRDRPEEIWLLTYWRDTQSYRTWHHSHLYHDSHRGIPKGLKLVPGETQIQEFEHVCS